MDIKNAVPIISVYKTIAQLEVVRYKNIITATQEKEDKFISTVACKAAVKANMSLNKEEVDNLMRKLMLLPNPFTCPHGRPTAIKMSRYEIERKFSRK